MRELIRLLSSCLLVGKIPGIWEFIFPLLYNSLPLLLFIASTLYATKSKRNHQSILYTHLALCLLLTTTCRLLFSFAAHSASSSVTFKTHPLLLLLYYIPLRLIRLIASSFCNHVIRAFFPSSVLQ